MNIDFSYPFVLLVFVFIMYSVSEYLKESKSEPTWLIKISKIKNFFSLNDSGLSKQPIFWIGVFFPLFFSAYLEYLILSTNDTLLTIKNISNIFDLSKVPLYITALTPTLGIFIANIHRSIQTKKQIDTSISQINISNNQYSTALKQLDIAVKKNLSDGFYSHYKYISDEFKNIILTEKIDSNYRSLREIKIIVKRPHALYKKVYPKSNVTSGFNNTVSNLFIKELTKKIKDSLDKLEIDQVSLYMIYNKGDKKEVIELINKLNINMKSVLEYLYADFSNSSYIKLAYDTDSTDNKNKKKLNINKSISEIGWGIRKFYDFIIIILDITGIILTENESLQKELNRYVRLININASIRKKLITNSKK